MKTIYAGLDIDGVVKLFTSEHGGFHRKIRHQEWLDILEEVSGYFGPGEMPVVTLAKEGQNE